MILVEPIALRATPCFGIRPQIYWRGEVVIALGSCVVIVLPVQVSFSKPEISPPAAPPSLSLL